MDNFIIKKRSRSTKKKELRNGVYARRKGHNKYEISYEDESVVVDLNLILLSSGSYQS